MNKKYIISPSILSADFMHMGDQIKQAEAAGAKWIHIDIMDGHFVPNLAMGPAMVKACKRVTNLPLDIHLMIEKPERHLKLFSDAGADHLTVHIEACPDIKTTLEKIRALECKAGIAINPATGPESIEPFLTDVDIVLVMTVNPGFSGQAFLPDVVPKISQIRDILEDKNPSGLIEVDGGINPETIRITYDAGARVFAAASSIFSHPGGIQEGINALIAVLD